MRQLIDNGGTTTRDHKNMASRDTADTILLVIIIKGVIETTNCVLDTLLTVDTTNIYYFRLFIVCVRHMTAFLRDDNESSIPKIEYDWFYFTF